METSWLFVTSALPAAHVHYLGANVATDRGGGGGIGGREEEGGCIDEGEKTSVRWRRGATVPAWHRRGHMGAYTCLYARVCTSTRGSGLVGYQGNGCVGLIRESPAGGEASEALPWQPPGQGGVCICAALAPLWIVVVEAV